MLNKVFYPNGHLISIIFIIPTALIFSSFQFVHYRITYFFLLNVTKSLWFLSYCFFILPLLSISAVDAKPHPYYCWDGLKHLLGRQFPTSNSHFCFDLSCVIGLRLWGSWKNSGLADKTTRALVIYLLQPSWMNISKYAFSYYICKL